MAILCWAAKNSLRGTSIQVGDFRAEINFLIFYRWVRYWSFCFSYRMRRLRQQICTVCAVYASKVLPHTLAICYRMRHLRQQNTQFYTALLPHAQCTLANCYRMHCLHQQFATACAAYASELLPYAPSMLAICNHIRQLSATTCAIYTNTCSPSIPYCFSYRMHPLRQQSVSVCGAYASNLLAYAPSTLASCYLENFFHSAQSSDNAE